MIKTTTTTINYERLVAEGLLGNKQEFVMKTNQLLSSQYTVKMMLSRHQDGNITRASNQIRSSQDNQVFISDVICFSLNSLFVSWLLNVPATC